MNAQRFHHTNIVPPLLPRQSSGSRPKLNESSTKPQLVLDVGGVLATNLTPRFWELLSDATHVDQQQLYADYKREIGPGLWRGTVSEAQFWDWLDRKAVPIGGKTAAADLKTPFIGAARYRTLLKECLMPLPALSLLPQWRFRADIHILSNHVQSWVLPLLEPYRTCLGHVVISSAVGYEKPQPELFRTAAKLLPAGTPVLFVDDSPSNLAQARQAGWHVLLADENGLWTDTVKEWLEDAAACPESLNQQ